VFVAGDRVLHLPTGVLANVKAVYAGPDPQTKYRIIHVRFDGGSFGAARATKFKLVTRKADLKGPEPEDGTILA